MPDDKKTPNGIPGYLVTIITVLASIAAALGSRTIPDGKGNSDGKTTPAPTPTPVVSVVTIVDYNRKVLTDNVEANTLFSVEAPEGSTLTPIASDGVQCIEVSDTKLVSVLSEGAVLQVVLVKVGAKPTIVSIRCNHSPQPPPNPIPDPKPEPIPVTVSYVSIAIVEDVLNRSKATAEILMDEVGWDSLNTPTSSYLNYPAKTTEPMGLAAIAALKRDNIPLPGIVLFDKSGSVLSTMKLCTPQELKPIVTRLTGGK